MVVDCCCGNPIARSICWSVWRTASPACQSIMAVLLFLRLCAGAGLAVIGLGRHRHGQGTGEHDSLASVESCGEVRLSACRWLRYPRSYLGNRCSLLPGRAALLKLAAAHYIPFITAAVNGEARPNLCPRRSPTPSPAKNSTQAAVQDPHSPRIGRRLFNAKCVRNAG